MKHPRLLAIALLVLSSLLYHGCSSPPTEQIQAAEKSMQQAREFHAEEFAPSDWKNAQQAWNDAQGLIAKQKYGDATPLLIRAKSRFDKARDIARAKREDLRREIEGKRKTIDTRYGSLRSTMAGENLSAATRKSLIESCKEIDIGIDKLKTALDQGDYTVANNTAMTTLRQVYEAEKEVEKAASKR